MDEFENHYSRGLVLYEQKRYELAEKEFGQAITFNPQSSAAHAMVGMSLARLGYFLRSKQEVEEAIRLAPDAAYPHYALSYVLGAGFTFDKSRQENLPFEVPRLVQNGSSVQATRAAEEAVRLEPENPTYLARLAYLRLWSRKWEDALTIAERGLARAPTDAGCLHVRALALTGLRRKEEADVAIERFVTQYPEHPFAHKLLGLRKIRSQPTDAEKHLLDSLRLDPQSVSAQKALGFARNLEFIRARSTGPPTGQTVSPSSESGTGPAKGNETPQSPAAAAGSATARPAPEKSLSSAGGSTLSTGAIAEKPARRTSLMLVFIVVAMIALALAVYFFVKL